MNRISHPEYEALAHLFARSDHDTYEESAYGQAMEAARVAIYRDMQAACADADVSAPCKFLPQVTDYERNRRTKQVTGFNAQRLAARKAIASTLHGGHHGGVALISLHR